MKTFLKAVLAVLISLAVTVPASADNIYSKSKWPNGPADDGSFFLIGIWLQQMKDVDAYKAIGINTFVAIDGSATAANLQTLKNKGMYTIASTGDNEAWNNLSDKTIIGWRMGDEPENWQYSKNITIKGKVWDYGPATSRIDPADYIEMYNWVKQNDPSRPITVNLGRGVADDSIPDRGWGWNNDDYYEYCKAGDMLGYDVYPVAYSGEDYIWQQGYGLDRLKIWGANKAMWNFFECTRAGNAKSVMSPADLKAEILLSLIHGSLGIQYFCHEFNPVEDDNAFLKYTDLTDMAKTVNNMVTSIAPALYTANVNGKVTVSTLNSAVPIEIMVKEYNNVLYILSCSGKTGTTKGTFTVAGLTGSVTANVLGESRTVSIESGVFTDNFAKWDAHVYAIPVSSSGGTSGTNPLNNIRVFPNPIRKGSSTVKKIKFDTILMPDVSIKIFNAGGQNVKTISESEYGNIGTAEWDLNAEVVPSGIYFYVAEDGAGNKKTGKIGISN